MTLCTFTYTYSPYTYKRSQTNAHTRTSTRVRTHARMRARERASGSAYTQPQACSQRRTFQLARRARVCGSRTELFCASFNMSNTLHMFKSLTHILIFRVDQTMLSASAQGSGVGMDVGMGTSAGADAWV